MRAGGQPCLAQGCAPPRRGTLLKLHEAAQGLWRPVPSAPLASTSQAVLLTAGPSCLPAPLPSAGRVSVPTANREPGIRAQAAGLGAGRTLGSEGTGKGRSQPSWAAATVGPWHRDPRELGGETWPTCPPPLEFIPVCQPSREEQTPALGDPGALKFQGVLGVGLAHGRLLRHECHMRNRCLVPAHLFLTPSSYIPGNFLLTGASFALRR